MFTDFIPLLVLATTVLSSPIAEPNSSPPETLSSSYTLTVGHNHHPDLKGAKINAASRAFYIGLAEPSSFCPVPPIPADECPPGTETVFAGTLSMSVEVPGGELCFVDPTGLVGFTGPHSASMPPGSLVSGFSWSPLHHNSVLGQRGTLDFKAPGTKGSGFWACPNVPDFITGAKWALYAEVPGFKEKGCIKLGGLRTTEYSKGFGAWEYT